MVRRLSALIGDWPMVRRVSALIGDWPMVRRVSALIGQHFVCTFFGTVTASEITTTGLKHGL